MGMNGKVGKEPMEEPIQVRFGPDLRPDGKFAVVRVGQGDNELRLTVEQAETLVKVLTLRLCLGATGNPAQQ